MRKGLTLPEAAVLVLLVISIISVVGVAVAHLIEKSNVKVGLIVDKVFVPAHTTTNYMPVKVGDITIQQPVTTTHPDRWSVSIRTTNGRTYTYPVSEGQYKELSISEYWVVGSYESTPEMPIEANRGGG